MPRQRRVSTLSPELSSLANSFAEAVAQLVERTIADRVGARVSTLAGRTIAKTSRATNRRKVHRPAHTLRACPFGGCQEPSKGPRYSWFCAAHRELPEGERAKVLAAATT